MSTEWTLETMRAAIGRRVRFTIQTYVHCPTCEQTTNEVDDKQFEGRITGWAMGGLYVDGAPLSVQVSYGDFDIANIRIEDVIFLDELEAT